MASCYFLYIPSISSGAERAFSEAKYTISDEFASLYVDTIQALDCLKSWFRSDTYIHRRRPYKGIEELAPWSLISIACVSRNGWAIGGRKHRKWSRNRSIRYRGQEGGWWRDRKTGAPPGHSVYLIYLFSSKSVWSLAVATRYYQPW